MRTDLALSSWMAASLGNNFATPTLLDQLQSPLALNVLEQATMAVIATMLMQARRMPLVDTRALREIPLSILVMGIANAVTCRLFMVSLHHLPLSLCHTIRACSPCCAAAFGLLSGERFSARQLSALPIMAAGFALAVSAQPSCSATGVAAAVGSLLALSVLQHLSHRILNRGSSEMQVQLMQCSLCFLFLLPRLPRGASTSLHALLTKSRSFKLLSVLNGLSDYVENTAATASCGLFDPLSFSVLDTLRRLTVILVCGFGVRGNPAGLGNVAGTLIVLAGALLYATGVGQGQGADQGPAR